MVFRSQHPDIHFSKDISLWSWLFDSEDSILLKYPPSEIQGYTDVLTEEHVSFSQVKTLTTYLSTALVKSYNLQPGDVVTVLSKNSIWYPTAMLGVLRAGGIAAGASPEYNNKEIAYTLKLAKSKFIFTTPNCLEKVVEAAQSVGIPKQHIFVIGEKIDGFTTLKDLFKIGQDVGDSRQVQPYTISKFKTNAETCGFLAFSSGTTGLPKAVMISHANVIAQCLQIQQISPSDHKKILSALPFYHITGLVHQLHLPIILNAHVYVLSDFTLDRLLKCVAKYKIEELLIVPPILIRLVREPDLVAKYDLSHVRRFSSGAAPLSAEILALLEKQFPNTGFKQGYGMTESCSAITSHPPSKYAYKYASRVGMLVASTEIKIIDPNTGKECGINVAGEIWARGPQITMGYLDNPKATKETFDEDGFIHTGDIGKFDEEGLLAITDRLKEMIKVKGIGVAPAELEDFLLGHPYVSDAAVLAIPDERAGERPKAFVVLKPGQKIEPREAAIELLEHVKANKSRDKRIVEIELVSVIPKSPAGKILRRKLKDMARDGSTRGTVVRLPEDQRAKL